MKKLFENIEGNRFKLLTENQCMNESLVALGLKKVFMNAGNVISYNHIESVGMGYIKDITTAKRVALQEARELAKEYGYKDSEEEAKFIKEEGGTGFLEEISNRPGPKPEHPESNMDNPEEKREVQIGKEILRLVKIVSQYLNNPNAPNESSLKKITELVEELVDLHTGKAVIKPGTGGVSYKPGSIY